ncbi:dipeptide/oligopeptide/nickel ABC transporter permease/ATP-binding protein [Streptomyces deccanensis]|uniref:dipeptide/oligopeptide/nickel ABC transporter permease/ATP-binding protein n=1 Tax=Streptomyces deccanensis TaxID=424188 RepID=UPI001EFB4BCB|nr:dipeptide/oligopeptide/nickel ABC transporter permease/ATP-binding protein [Streptomyces deccanensis]ULR48306.1 dipeptide/oligopeptide/nickel ABC transporter permease/ATP-binding protein [Streptomyces deccanensis]
MTETVADAEPTASPSANSRFVRRLLRRPLAVVCLVYLAILVVIAVAAPMLLPQVGTERAGDLGNALRGPSGAHPLGVDSLGRDVLQRLLVGTRVTLVGVVEAMVVVLALGIPVGLVAGYVGGKVDRAITWVADLVLSLPAIILVIVVLSVFPQSVAAAMVTLGVLAAPGLVRVVRAATLPVREQLYVAAARVSGMSRTYIITRHVFPRVMGPIIVQASLLAATALLVQTGLAFLSLIAAPPQPSWGGMVADGVGALFQQPWLIWPPGLAIALTVLAFGLLGDAVRDASTEGWSPKSALPLGDRHRSAPTRAAAAATVVPGTNDSLLSVRDLTVSYATPTGPVRAVEGVSFDIARGETVGVVGESGCGKTTTALAVIALLGGGGRIDSGHVLFDGRDLAALPESELQAVRGTEIGYVSQEPMVALDPAFRIGRQLAEAVRTNTGMSRAKAKKRAVELLERVQLPEPHLVARRYPHELSGGMAQRVVVARALAGEPKLLIADEPTTALDVTIQVEILDLLRTLQRERGMAIMLVTHDLGVVADMCDRVVVMYAGQVAERAGVQELFGDPHHPYTRALLASNPHSRHGSAVLPTIPGAVPMPGSWPRGCHFRPRCAHATERCGGGEIPLLEIGASHEARCLYAHQIEGVS